MATPMPVEYYAEAYRKMLEVDHGQSSKKIAPLIGVSHNTVCKWRREGFSPNMYPQIDADTLEFARQSLEAGNSYNRVAKIVGVDNKTLRKHFPGMGGIKAPIVDSETLAFAKASLEAGNTYAFVSATTGVSRGTLAKHFPGMGRRR